ncbi:L-histidine N(alpha)-methyltransferase [Pleurocapsales cyanobacterium LEGE 06147]|nr:L-histidine N(alpha)-methyltransferase [Pleurocapsales cyanobacterium LEGE 06147]
MSQTAASNRFSFEERLQIEYLLDNYLEKQNEGKDVIDGLTQSPKSLPPRYFYDSKGSQLFEQICALPEYYPTRTEAAILQQYAEKIAKITGSCELIELGSGSSTKTRLLLDAYSALNYPLRYFPIDVSGSILKESAYNLLKDYATLQVHGLVSTYERALSQLKPSSLPQRIIVFLGSTIGNFTPSECDRFISQVSTTLDRGDYFLLGIDLQKPKHILEAAYNDSQGITTAFNLNILQHLNWRFRGNFNLDSFSHGAIYNESAKQIEMYLVSQQTQVVCLETLDLLVQFTAGEKILTEISRKFDRQKLKDYLKTKGLKVIESWTDSNQWFALLLCRREINKNVF